ncbi:MAG: T9SS type A sorting domain-containing protein [Bacteroidetes bacterium]|nr:T9SS type A sorting domain-containing protein [Bacteroidota bacterium]
MKPVKIMKWPLLIYALLQSSASFAALTSPVLNFPEDKREDLNPDELVCRYTHSSSRARVQIALDASFNMPVADQLTTASVIAFNQLKLNKTYYWRVKSFNSNYTDSSSWSEVRTFKTIDQLTINYPYEEVNYQLVGLGGYRSPGYHNLGMQIQCDTSANFNTAFLQSSFNGLVDFAFDHKTYYVRSRNFTEGDTSTWSETQLFHTNFNLRWNPEDYCYANTNNLVSGNIFFGYNQADVYVNLYLDSQKTQPFFDTTFLSRSGNAYFRKDFVECHRFWVDIRIEGSHETAYLSRWYQMCNPNEKASIAHYPFTTNVKKEYNLQQFNVPHCFDGLDVELDTSDQYQSPYLIQRSYTTDTSLYFYDWIYFPVNPINYQGRYRIKSGDFKSEWAPLGELVRAQLMWNKSGEQSDSTNLKAVYRLSGLVDTTYDYELELQLDTTSTFNSPAGRSVFTPITQSANFQASLDEPYFTDTIFMRARVTSPDGKSSWTPLLYKQSVNKPIIGGGSVLNRYYPFGNPSVTPSTFNTPIVVHYQYASDSLFTPGKTLSVWDNTSPELETGQTYFLRARMEHAYDTSDWSDIVQVNTLNRDYILNPHLVYPEVEQTNVAPATTTFKWQPRVSDLASAYTLMVYEEEINVNRVVFFSTTQKSEMDVPQLKPATHYVWTVHATGKKNQTSLNEIRHFYTTGFNSTHSPFLSENALYPNPSNGTMIIPDWQEVTQIHLFDLTGKPISTFIPSSESLNLHHLPAGTYLIQIERLNQLNQMQRITLLN